MSKHARKELEQRRDELERLRERCRHLFAKFGFGIFLSSPERTRSQLEWEYFGGFVDDFADKNSSVPIEKNDISIDPFPDGLRCFRWWGNAEAIDEFKKWADDTSIALWEYSTLRDFLSVGKGYYGAMWALVEFARKKPPVAALVESESLKIGTRSRPLAALRNDEPPLQVNLLNIREDGVSFASKALTALLGTSSNAVQGIPSLSKRQYYILQALLALKAVTPDNRRTTAEIATKAEGFVADPEGFKKPISELAALGYVGTKDGRGGGCWLTAKGNALAKRLFGPGQKA